MLKTEVQLSFDANRPIPTRQLNEDHPVKTLHQIDIKIFYPLHVRAEMVKIVRQRNGRERDNLILLVDTPRHDSAYLARPPPSHNPEAVAIRAGEINYRLFYHQQPHIVLGLSSLVSISGYWQHAIQN